jgi:hypothetical protein
MAHNVPPQNVYRVYQRAATGFTSFNSLREEVEERAETFCRRQGKGMLVLGDAGMHQLFSQAPAKSRNLLWDKEPSVGLEPTT